jgi:hypothetical protein
LNVRAGPGVRNTIVARIDPRSLAWAHPIDMKKGWAFVSVTRQPGGESGPVLVVDGWVNARYLGEPAGR